VRALLDLNLHRENEATLPLVPWQDLLQLASTHLQILDPELGEEELIESVAAEFAKVTALIAKNSQRQ